MGSSTSDSTSSGSFVGSGSSSSFASGGSSGNNSINGTSTMTRSSSSVGNFVGGTSSTSNGTSTFSTSGNNSSFLASRAYPANAYAEENNGPTTRGGSNGLDSDRANVSRMGLSSSTADLRLGSGINNSCVEGPTNVSNASASRYYGGGGAGTSTTSSGNNLNLQTQQRGGTTTTGTSTLNNSSTQQPSKTTPNAIDYIGPVVDLDWSPRGKDYMSRSRSMPRPRTANGAKDSSPLPSQIWQGYDIEL